ncbi:pyridoxal phosphate-dependent aminotransferase, partial [Streptomyces sp. NPDC023723]
MRRTAPEGHGPVRFGPPPPDDGLPAPAELLAVLAAAADRTGQDP